MKYNINYCLSVGIIMYLCFNILQTYTRVKIKLNCNGLKMNRISFC